MNTPSLFKRYIFKFTSNVIQMLGGIIQVAIIPKAIGPAAYGNFTFLIEFFKSLFTTCNVGSNEAFFTKLSKNTKDKGLILFYFLFISIITVLIGIFIILGLTSNFQDQFWPEQKSIHIIYGFLVAFLMLTNQITLTIADAYALTPINETLRVGHKVIMILSLIFLWHSNQLNLNTVFYYHMIFLFLLTCSSFFLFYKHLLLKDLIQKIDFQHYFNTFYKFCSPLIAYSIITSLVILFDLWFLQKISGSTEQGLYGFSLKISTIAILFTASIIPLLTRDFSKAHGKNDINTLRRLFPKSLKLFYCISATICFFMVTFAEPLIQIFGGASYQSAYLPFIIMCLFPIHQTYGQLNSTFLYATDQTKLTRNIGICTAITGLIFSYLFIAPKSIYGLELNAFGLSLKMFLINIVSVNIMLYYNTKYLKINYKGFLIHQIVSLFPIFIASCLTFHIYNLFLHFGIIISLIIASAIYFIISFSIFYNLPYLVGLDSKTYTKKTINSLLLMLKKLRK